MTAAKTIAQDGRRWALAWMCALAGCAHVTLIDDGTTVEVPAGPFLMGSDPVDRARAAELSVRAGTFGPDSAQAIAAELPARQVTVEAFAIMRRPVTQAEYRNFVDATGAPEPYIDPHAWAQMDTGYAYAEVERALWSGGAPNPERAEHPVVLVTRDEAIDYCRWWGDLRNGHGSLPTEAQWEKAARGTDGRTFPWGDHIRPGLVNSAESGFGGPVPAGSTAALSSPYGALDMAGNVFEWTRTRLPNKGWVVKGGAFNADAATARAAARHGRPSSQRHPAIGFRCAVIPYD